MAVKDLVPRRLALLVMTVVLFIILNVFIYLIFTSVAGVDTGDWMFKIVLLVVVSATAGSILSVFILLNTKKVG